MPMDIEMAAAWAAKMTRDDNCGRIAEAEVLARDEVDGDIWSVETGVDEGDFKGVRHLGRKFGIGGQG
jgi:hypothetical protein